MATREDHCIFDDDPSACECKKHFGLTPRSECDKHSDEDHYPSEDTP